MVYDVICIGSSPKLFMKLVEYAKQGKKILIIESSASLGGNWKTVNFSSSKDVEFGCFVIPAVGINYDYLQNEMNIEMVEQEYQPFIYSSNGKKLPLNSELLKQPHIYEKISLKNLIWRVYFWYKNHQKIKHKAYTTKYFAHGIKSLLDSYHYFIKEYGIDVKYSETAKKVHVSHKKNTVTVTTDKNIATCNRLLIGTGIHLDKITTDKFNFYLNSSRSNIFTFTLCKIKTKKDLKFSYVDFINLKNNTINGEYLKKIDFYKGISSTQNEYKLLWRMTNITTYATDVEDGFKLLCIDTNGWLPKSGYEKDMIKIILDFIKNIDLVDSDTELIDFKWCKNEANTIGTLESSISKYLQPYIETTNSIFLGKNPNQ